MGFGGVFGDHVNVHVVDIPSPHGLEVGVQIKLKIGLIAALSGDGAQERKLRDTKINDR